MKSVCVCFFGATIFGMKLTRNVPLYVASKIGSHVMSCVFIPCWAGREATKVVKFWQIHMARPNPHGKVKSPFNKGATI